MSAKKSPLAYPAAAGPGKKLTICWGEPDGEKRPTKFVTRTARGAGTFLETYQKLDD